MKNRLAMLDSTCSAGASPRRQLVDVLEGYLADLEQGHAPDQEALAGRASRSGRRAAAVSRQPAAAARRDARHAGDPYDVEPAMPASMTAPSARQIGDYRIVREIGRGGMGIVYEAHQKSLNRHVALKILPFAAVLDQRQIARFRNEAQAAAQLHHPHIVPVFAVGQEQGVYYYAMQYIDGQSLEQAIAELRHDSRPVRRRDRRKAVGAAERLDDDATRRRSQGPRHRTASIGHGDFFPHGRPA